MKPPRWLPPLQLERLRPELEVNHSMSAAGGKWGQPGESAGKKAGRVSNLAAADFREGSELMNSLLLAVESIGTRIAIRQKAYRD